MACRALIAVSLFALAGCATHPRTVAFAPPVAPAAAPIGPPAGAAPNLQIPARLADGSFATPNRGLSGAAALWHLRTGLNVAALACRGPDEAALVAGYNRFLAAYRPQLAAAERSVAVGHATISAHDAAMTRLYNYWAQPPAQAGFCAAAAHVIAGATGVPAKDLPGFAADAVAELDRPFTDFYRAYADWRDARASGVAYAASAPVPVGQQASAPRLEYDPAVFRMP
ncbi:hypothetical protein BH09PSE4_BH09PSE4_00740 [soil metagenome]